MLNGISANMVSLLNTGKYDAINSEDPTMLGYYILKYLYAPFTLQYYITTYGRVGKAGGLVVKSEYFSIMTSKTN